MTAFEDVKQAFYHYIENDVDFFNYFELDEDECMEVAGQRAGVLLNEATSYLSRKIGMENVFTNKMEESFAEDLSDGEVNLLVKAMFLCYLQRDITMLRTFHGVMSSSDLNMYSPANERKTYIAMVKQYEDDLKVEISEYAMIDRETGMFKTICG